MLEIAYSATQRPPRYIRMFFNTHCLADHVSLQCIPCSRPSYLHWSTSVMPWSFVPFLTPPHAAHTNATQLPLGLPLLAQSFCSDATVAGRQRRHCSECCVAHALTVSSPVNIFYAQDHLGAYLHKLNLNSLIYLTAFCMLRCRVFLFFFANA